MTASSPSPRWSRDTKALVTVIALLVGISLVYLARDIIGTLALAAVVAYIFQPIVSWFERRGKSRGSATALCVLLLILLLALGPALLTPSLVRSIDSAINILNRLPAAFDQWVNSAATSQTVIGVGDLQFNLAEVVQQVNASLSNTIAEFRLPNIQDAVNYLMTGLQTATNVVQAALGIAGKIVTVAFNILLLLVLIFFLTKDGNQIAPSLHSLILPAYRAEVVDLGRRLNQVWKSFFRGQLLLAAVIGVVVTIATTILGMQSALVLGILAGVMEVVPNLGPVLAMIPAVLVALVQGPPDWLHVSNLVFALIVTLVYFAVQQLENNILVPRIMGRSLNLHPLFVLVGVVVGAKFAGVLGAFLAAPVLASLKVLGLYAHAKILDRNPAEDLSQSEEASEPRTPGKVVRLLRRALRRARRWYASRNTSASAP